MTKTLSIADRRMFQLMEWAVKNDMAKSDGAFLDKIGFEKRNVSNVKSGKQSFRIDHITAACKLTGANANWILGIEKNMFRDLTATDPLQLLKQATATIESQLQFHKILPSKNGVNKKSNNTTRKVKK